MVKVYRIDDGKPLKTTNLGFVRVSPLLLTLIDRHVKRNHIENKSEFIRLCITKELGLSVDEIIRVTKPFLPVAPRSLVKKVLKEDDGFK